MKIANYAKLTVFVREGENEAEIRGRLVSLIPFNLDEEKIRLKRTTALGFNEKKIIILEIELLKDKHINKFINAFAEALNQEQKQLLIRQVESRLDQEFNFFIRLDKDKMLDSQYWITDSGNCVHIKINIACFPRRREKVISMLEEIFK